MLNIVHSFKHLKDRCAIGCKTYIYNWQFMQKYLMIEVYYVLVKSKITLRAVAHHRMKVNLTFSLLQIHEGALSVNHFLIFHL
jgi:hypothetical protein